MQVALTRILKAQRNCPGPCRSATQLAGRLPRQPLLTRSHRAEGRAHSGDGFCGLFHYRLRFIP